MRRANKMTRKFSFFQLNAFTHRETDSSMQEEPSPTGEPLLFIRGTIISSLKNSFRKWFLKEPWFERFFVEPEMVP